MTPPTLDTNAVERDWPEDSADENGNYRNICNMCGHGFVGYKRRVVCKACTPRGPLDVIMIWYRSLPSRARQSLSIENLHNLSKTFVQREESAVQALTQDLAAETKRADTATAETAVLLQNVEDVAIYVTAKKDYEMDNGEAGVIVDWTALVALNQVIDGRTGHATAFLLEHRRLTSELAAAKEGTVWRGIESAPQSKIILMWAATDIGEDGAIKNWKMATGHWHKGYTTPDDISNGYTGWWWDGRAIKSYEPQPTHWLPLPAPPIRNAEVT